MELINEFRVAVPIDEAWAVLTDVERIAPCLPGAQLQEIDGDEHRGLVKVKVGPITAQYKGAATFVEQDPVSHRVVLRAEGRDTRGQGNATATVTATMQADGDGTTVKVVTDLTVTGKVAQFGRGVLADVSAKLIGQFVDNLSRDVLSAPAGERVAPAAPTSEPAAAATQPTATQPAATQPAATQPTATQPAATQPAATQPAATQPAATQPAATQPAATQPAATQPAAAASNGAAGNGAAAGPVSTVRRINHPDAEPVDLLAHAGTPVAKRALPPLLVIAAVVVVWQVRKRRGRSG